MDSDTGRIYPHPLDYVSGLKYSLTSLSVNHEYRITPSSFIVREVIDEGYLVKRVDLHGREGYIVVRVVKRGLDTFEALRILSRKLDIPVENIHFHGLKDKNATTTSYFYIKRLLVDERIFPIQGDKVVFEIAGYTRFKPGREIFKGNEFEVLIQGLDERQQEVMKKILELISRHGLPAYYGYQRFGVKRYNTHLLGKYVVKRRENCFSRILLDTMYPGEDLEAIVKRIRRDFTGFYYEGRYVRAGYNGLGLKNVLRALNEIIIDAYAGYLYNLLLNKIIEEKGFVDLDKEYPMPGCIESIELYSGIFSEEGLTLEEARSLPCYYRNGLFKPLNTRMSCAGDVCRLVFMLEPGLYATIVLRELFKEKLVLN